jgi:hypothetical protein
MGSPRVRAVYWGSASFQQGFGRSSGDGWENHAKTAGDRRSGRKVCRGHVGTPSPGDLEFSVKRQERLAVRRKGPLVRDFDRQSHLRMRRKNCKDSKS